MSNLHAVLYPLSAIIDDVIREYPALCKPLKDDLFRLNNLVKSRGETVLTVSLPKLGKIYDRGFQTGILDRKLIPHELGSWRKNNEIFSHLIGQTYRPSGELVYPEARIVFFTRCILFAYKKLDRESPDTAKIKAVKDFLKIEEALSEPTRQWNGTSHNLLDNGRCLFTDLAIGSSDYLLLDTLDRVSGILGFNRSPDIRTFKFKHGPGAVSDKRKNNDKYDHTTWPERSKLLFPYSTCIVTESSFIEMYKSREFNNHKASLIVAPIMNIKHTDTSHFRGIKWLKYVQVPAKLIAVPKTYDKPRLIASEPTANQFLQQGLLHWMRSNMHPVLGNSIDFLSQTLSKDMCKIASTSDDVATVDLSSASDRMTCRVVERLFSSNEDLVQLLYACRTSSISDSVTNSFTDLQMKKFGAQGAAVTFPVQTILYAMCAYASIIFDNKHNTTKRKLKSVSKSVRVYGDDIIMPSSSVATLDRLLSLLELKVNAKKTFVSGPFRESCGMDAYQGFDVTPCYIKTDCPDDNGLNLQSWIDVSNNAYEKGLYALSQTMINSIPHHFRDGIYYSSEDTAIMTVLSEEHQSSLYYPVNGNSIKIKYDTNLHKWLIPTYVEKMTKSKRCRRDNILSLFQYFTENPSPELPWESGYGENIYARKFKRAWVSP